METKWGQTQNSLLLGASTAPGWLVAFSIQSQFRLSEIYEPFSLRACISKRAVIGEHTKNGVYMKGAAMDLLLAWPRVVCFVD